MRIRIERKVFVRICMRRLTSHLRYKPKICDLCSDFVEKIKANFLTDLPRLLMHSANDATR